MPNGHGIPLGCFVCTQYHKGEPNPLSGYCKHHKIEVHMDFVCADFDNAVNHATHTDPLVEGILYAYVDVEGYGYPPPTELVPLGKIPEYKLWDDKERKQGWSEAQKQARKKFEQHK